MIYLLIAYRATNLTDLARKMGRSRQSLYNKIKRNTLKKEEMIKIANIMGARYISCFMFPDGIVIGDNIKKKKGGAVTAREKK